MQRRSTHHWTTTFSHSWLGLALFASYVFYSWVILKSSSSAGATVRHEPCPLHLFFSDCSASILRRSRSCVQFLPFFFESSSTESSHVIAGLPASLALSGVWNGSFLQGVCLPQSTKYTVTTEICWAGRRTGTANGLHSGDIQFVYQAILMKVSLVWSSSGPSGECRYGIFRQATVALPTSVPTQLFVIILQDKFAAL
jgi:hypothetical protein